MSDIPEQSHLNVETTIHDRQNPTRVVISTGGQGAIAITLNGKTIYTGVVGTP